MVLNINNLQYGLVVYSADSPIYLSCPNWHTNPKINMEMQGTQNSLNTILNKKNKLRECFKTYYKAIIIKIMYY